MLKLRRATVIAADPLEGDSGEQALVVELCSAGERRAAIADVALVGAARAGDELIVNVQALDLRSRLGRL